MRIREAANVEALLISEMRIKRRGPDGFILVFPGTAQGAERRRAAARSRCEGHVSAT